MSALQQALMGIYGVLVSAWTPADNFTSGQPGLWYDPSDIARYAAADGPELVVNGGFDTDTVWNKPAGVSISAGVASAIAASGDFYESVGSTAPGKCYRVTYTLSGVTAGSVAFRFYSSNFNGTARSTNGTFTETIPQGNVYILVNIGFGLIGFTGNIDNVSIKEVTQIGTATLFPDSAGTSPATDVGQPGGLMLDKRLGLVPGPELVVNGDIGNGVTGWSGNNATLSASAGQLTLTTTDTNAPCAFQGIPTVSGRWYRLRIEKTQASPALSHGVRAGSGGVGAADSASATLLTSGVTELIFLAKGPTTTLSIGYAFSAVGQTLTIDNISVKELPGNHISQPTASARPLISARVNLLVQSENFADAIWQKNNGAVVDAAAVMAPDGTLTAARVTFNGGDVRQALSSSLAGNAAANVWVKGAAGQTLIVLDNLDDAAVTATLTGAWQRLSAASSANPATMFYIGVFGGRTATVVDVWHPQVESGAVSTYQRVNTATDYDTAGFPQFLSFDGLDDGLSTGPITPGANMDCFIAIRRNGEATAVAALGDNSKYFGVFGDTSAGTAADVNCGSPTWAANGVSLNGGASGATRMQLAGAAPLAQWIVLEARNLNLTAWVEFRLAAYPGFRLNGDIAGVILCPAGDAATRQKNRQFLGAKVGLTLP